MAAYAGRTYTALFQHTLGTGTALAGTLLAPDRTPQIWRPGGVCIQPKPRHRTLPPPPERWQEHWFEHNRLLRLAAYNDVVAIYYDEAVDRRAVTWMLPYLTRLWQYAQKTYGGGPSNKMRSDRLYSIHHEGRYFGGHPSTVYDASHDFRNVSDVGGQNWITPQYEVVTHETGHIVEGIASGVHGSPSFPLWGDSKWMEFYIYDAYVGLGMADEARKFYDRVRTTTDSFPRAGTHWFRDWFYPLWRDHGHAQVMVRYFRLLGKYFPTANGGRDFARDLNWGEFVHFMSGAAGVNLKALATKAFGWPANWEAQYQQARRDFPGITYA